MIDKIIIDLVEEDNKKVSYEVLDVQDLNGKTYVVAYPMDDTEVVVFREEPIDGTDQSKYIPEEDATIINAVYESFKTRMSDHIDFVDKDKFISEGEVVEFNGKEYVCFKIIEDDSDIYAYFITKIKPVEIKFTKELIDNGEVKLDILNDPYDKEKALELLQKNKEDE